MKALLIIATIFGVVLWLGCVFALQVPEALMVTISIALPIVFGWCLHFDLKI